MPASRKPRLAQGRPTHARSKPKGEPSPPTKRPGSFVRSSRKFGRGWRDANSRLEALASSIKDKSCTVDAQRAELEGTRAAVARLRLENEAQRSAIDALEHEKNTMSDRAEVQRRTVELALKARVIEQRTLEFERKDAENAELRAKVAALEGAAGENDKLRCRVRDLEARAFAESFRDSGWPAPATHRPNGIVDLESSLTLGLRGVLESERGGHVAVLADMRGLLIAASGDGTHVTSSRPPHRSRPMPLSAFASFYPSASP